MATKDVSDVQVVEACLKFHTNRSGKHSLDLLVEATGQPMKVCYRAMERAGRRGLIDYGVSLRTAFATEKGKVLETQVKKFKVQVNVGIAGKDRWMDMGPSSGSTYVFNDEEVALHAAKQCYPDHPDRVRVIPLDDAEA